MTTNTGVQGKQHKSDFKAAEEVSDILSGRDKAEQERIIRWVSESLGLLAPSPELPSHVAPSTQLPSPQQQAPVHAPASLPKDIKSFVEEKAPKSDVHFVTVVAYFYQFEASPADHKEAITAADLRGATRLANWGRFKTPTIPLNNAVKQGYLDRADRGAYAVNAVGENLVAMTLPGARDGNGGARPTKKKRSKATTKKAAKKKAGKKAS